MKTLAISKTFNISTMRNLPTHFLNLLNSIQKDFIWNKSHAKIKHCSIIADYKEGGYKGVDISSKRFAMKISWIKRFLDDNFYPWKILCSYQLSSRFIRGNICSDIQGVWTECSEVHAP